MTADPAPAEDTWPALAFPPNAGKASLRSFSTSFPTKVSVDALNARASITSDTSAAELPLVPPKDATRIRITAGCIAYDADAFAFVIPKHSGMSSCGRRADYADFTLTPDTIALLRLAYYPEAYGGVNPFYGGKPVTTREADYTSLTTLTPDTIAIL